jgi:pimeloyl-ACP methyl ester carboxylesterase
MIQLGVEKPILVGHSWGGTLALYYALLYPKEISGMVLLAPSAFPDGHGNVLESAIAHTPVLGKVLIKALKPLVIHEINVGLQNSFFPAPVPRHYKYLAEKIWSSPDRLKSYIFDSLALRSAENQISNRYGEIRIPVTIISGLQDQVVGYKSDAVPLHDAIRGSRLITLGTTGHAIQYENPRAVVDAVIAMKGL